MAMQERLLEWTVGKVEEMGLLPEGQAGQPIQGNIDLSNRPQVKEPGRHRLNSPLYLHRPRRPDDPHPDRRQRQGRLRPGGNPAFQQIGQHLGVFGDQSADRYARNLHEQEASRIGKGGAPSQLGKNSTNVENVGEEILPPRPSAVIVRKSSKVSRSRASPDIKQWTQEDKAKWNSMSPEQKKA